MFNDLILHFILGFIASFLGGIPFGLVNLAIVHLSISNNSKEAFNMAIGATSIETIFALLSIFLGSIIAGFVDSHPAIKSFIFLIFLIAALFFILKKSNNSRFEQGGRFPSLIKGALLMMISFQVVLLWIGISVFYRSRGLLDIKPVAICFFLPGVFTGKMLAYLLYDKLGNYIRTNMLKLAKNINKVVGYILLTISTIYLIRFFITLNS